MARRNHRTSYGPRAGASLVDNLFVRVGLDTQAREYRAMHAWVRMAGPRLARNTRPERVMRDVLIVRVATAPWANELSYLRSSLLEKLQSTPGAQWIKELRFTIGPLEGLPSWDDDPAEPRPPQPDPGPPPPVDAGKVAGALMQVTDPELRAALAELFARANSPSSRDR
jgi:hypothetical protein